MEEKNCREKKTFHAQINLPVPSPIKSNGRSLMFIKHCPCKYACGLDSPGIKPSLVTTATRVRSPASALDRIVVIKTLACRCCDPGLIPASTLDKVVVACPRLFFSPGTQVSSTTNNANIRSFENKSIISVNFLCNQSKINELPHDKTNKTICAPSEDSDQPGHPPSLISLCCPHEETLGPQLLIEAFRIKKHWDLSYP